MSNICKTVSLRTRPIKKGAQLSFYLDYYPGYRDPETMKTIRHESLGIYIFAKPKSQRERDYNERMKEKAEAIRCRRYESIVNERYDFFDNRKMKGDFLEYFRKKAAKHNHKWANVCKHFERFVNGKCSFEEINVDLCNKFMEYLKNARPTLHLKQTLHTNTIAAYWSTFRHCLHEAYREKKIKENPNGFLERIDTIPTEKEHLSQPELIRLAETDCDVPVLKKAFLFSCLTGLRKSDIKQLTWEDIQPYGDGGMYVTLRMQKTKDIVHNPISDEALELIGERSTGLVFKGFKDCMTQPPLKRWLKAAGITKHISFHSARHSFGSLRVDAGTDVYVVQKLLGHKNVATTEIYSKLADERKRQSVNKFDRILKAMHSRIACNSMYNNNDKCASEIEQKVLPRTDVAQKESVTNQSRTNAYELCKAESDMLREQNKSARRKAVSDYIYHAISPFAKEAEVAIVHSEVMAWLDDYTYIPNPIILSGRREALGMKNERLTSIDLRHFIWNIAKRLGDPDKYTGYATATFAKTLFPDEFALTEIDSIRNFTVSPYSGYIHIDKPDSGSFEFHYGIMNAMK